MGRLYTWYVAQKACPKGWRLPTDKEWKMLADLFGGPLSAGKHLKSKSEFWKDRSRGTNKSLFNVMPYGNTVIGNGYYAFGLGATFWSGDEVDITYAKDWVLSDGDRFIDYKGHKANTGNSVRCIKDSLQ